MPSPTEKALRAVLTELKSSRKANEALAEKFALLSNAVDGMRAAIGEFHHDIEARHETHEKAVNQLGEKMKRVERVLKLRPA